MDDPVRISEGHGLADPHEEPQALRQCREVRKSRIETLPPNELHRVERAAVRQPARIVDGLEARMLEPGEDPGLVENRFGRGLAVERHVHDLERETSLQHVVLDLEDGAHAASSDRPDEPVACAGEIGREDGVAQPGERRVG